MTQERILPQLMMRRPNLQGLKEMQLPEGYSLRSFCQGDVQAWNKIIAESFDSPFDSEKFEKVMRQDAEFMPERVLFVCCNDIPVATASAWLSSKWDNSTGYLHMVGVCPGHQGKRLGYLITLAVLEKFAEDGRTTAVLSTDDFRLAALKTYLNLGFEPYLIHENQRERWKEVFEKLKREDLVEVFSEKLKRIHNYD